jgi:hypothetical protein
MAVPVSAIIREDTAYRSISNPGLTNSSSDSVFIKSEFNKLTRITLWEPAKVIIMLENMYKAGMIAEMESTIRQLHKFNSDDVIANDLLATYFANNGQFDLELKTRKHIRRIDPLNYQLELVLAKRLIMLNMMGEAKESIARITRLAPKSQEAIEAEGLLFDKDNESN